MAMKIDEKYKDSREAPLYKATERLLSQIDDLFDFLQKGRKHTHGQHMLHIVLGMLDCVSLAYDFPKMRAEQLQLYLTRYNNLCTILKMCEKKGYLVNKGKNIYVEILPTLGIAHRQAKGWLKDATKPEPLETTGER